MVECDGWDFAFGARGWGGARSIFGRRRGAFCLSRFDLAIVWWEQTMVCRHQTMVWRHQTIVCREQTKAEATQRILRSAEKARWMRVRFFEKGVSGYQDQKG